MAICSGTTQLLEQLQSQERRCQVPPLPSLPQVPGQLATKSLLQGLPTMLVLTGRTPTALGLFLLVAQARLPIRSVLEPLLARPLSRTLKPMVCRFLSRQVPYRDMP